MIQTAAAGSARLIQAQATAGLVAEQGKNAPKKAPAESLSCSASYAADSPLSAFCASGQYWL